MNTTQREHLRALTGLRFVAAAWVLTFHTHALALTFTKTEYLFASPWLRRVEDVIACGPAGVTLFFVLSGFILTYTYCDAGRGLSTPRWSFWAARFARVYPVYALGLVLGFWPWLRTIEWHQYSPLVTAEKVGGVFAATVLLLQAWIPRMALRWNSVGWSLSNEAFFYVAFAFAAAPLARLRARSLLAVAAAAYAASMFATTAVVAGATGWLGHVYYHPLFRATDFVIGMAAGQLYLRARASDTGAGWAGRAVVASTAVIAAVLLASGQLPRVVAQNSLLAPAFAVAIYALAFGRGRVARALAAGVCVRLGEASYALYILHLLLLEWMFAAAVRAGVWTTWWFTPAAVLVAVGVSLAVFRWYEEPMRRWVRARLGGVRRALPGEVEAGAALAKTFADHTSITLVTTEAKG